MDKEQVDGLVKGILWDTELRGFGVRCSGNTKTFILKYRNALGVQRWLTLGRYGEITLAQAKKMVAKARLQILTGEDPAKEKKRKRDSATIGDMIDLYNRVHLPSLKPSSKVSYEYVITKYLEPIRGMKTEDLDYASALHLHDSIPSQSQARFVVIILKKAHDLCIKHGLMHKANPWKLIKLKESEEQSRPMSIYETVELLKAIDASDLNPHSLALLKLLLLTGARRDELRTLQWEQIHLEEKSLIITDHKTSKRSKTKVIWLNAMAVSTIESIQKLDETYVFVASKAPMSKGCLAKTWGILRKALGIPDVRIHDLRHTYASLLINEGVALDAIGPMLGQKRTTTTQRYAHLFNPTKIKIVEKIDNLLTPKTDMVD